MIIYWEILIYLMNLVEDNSNNNKEKHKKINQKRNSKYLFYNIFYFFS